jgi:hypothetical protein
MHRLSPFYLPKSLRLPELKIRPPFEDELKAQGFERILKVERDEEGFARPVHVSLLQ